jgi:hypothetical protein
MNVVGHHHEFVIEQFNVRAHLGGAEPFFINDPTDVVEARFVVNNLTEEGLTRVRDQCDEVPTFGVVVVVLHADGAAVVEGGRFMH